MAEDRREDGTPSPRRWPGLRLTAAVRMAFDARKLAIAAAGLLLLQLGWSLLDLAFLGSVEVTPDVLPSGASIRPGMDSPGPRTPSPGSRIGCSSPHASC